MVPEPRYSLVLTYHSLTCVINFFWGHMSGCDRPEPGNSLVLEPDNMNSLGFGVSMEERNDVGDDGFLFDGGLFDYSDFGCGPLDLGDRS